MQLQLQTFSDMVANAAAAVQGAARQLVDLTVGSTLRALLEANASLALWLQWLIIQVLSMTRAATSNGADLDSWVADFSVARLPAVAAIGQGTFSRFNPSSTALVPLQTTVRTADGSQSFVVTEDPANSSFSPTQQAYLIGQGVASVTVPLQALVAGIAGNVQPGAISLIAAALPGVDMVTNSVSCIGGLDAETDSALRARFQNFLASRARATIAAVSYAITSVRQGLSYTIAENTLPDGSALMGSFLVTVDDGSGAPPAALLAEVSAAVEAMRPIGVSFAVLPPKIVPAQISMTITTPSNAVHADAVAGVVAAVGSYVNALPIGAALPWSRLVQIAFDASTAVANVSSVLINGAAADLVAAPNGVIKTSSVIVS
ncbi:MAG: baseplate J/gp47 family protein [Rhodospirillales bacterium]|nr:baseplate J/gp47 family protein [Rhodospirillales bacterium]